MFLWNRGEIKILRPTRGRATDFAESKRATTMIENDRASEPDGLRLDQFLKLCFIAGTGGHAKFMIQNGEVKLNGEIETRRRHKVVAGDVVEVGGQEYLVKHSASAD